MPRGDESAHTDTQQRKAEHIEDGYEKHGVAESEARSRAATERWATCRQNAR